jgi:hypothetical protein
MACGLAYVTSAPPDVEPSPILSEVNHVAV